MMDMVFSLTGILAAGLMVVGGLVAVLALRNLASVVLLVGTVLGLLSSVGWMAVTIMQKTGTFNPAVSFFMAMRVLGTFGWLLTAVGVVLLAFAVAGLRKQNQALEGIMAGSQTDRVA